MRPRGMRRIRYDRNGHQIFDKKKPDPTPDQLAATAKAKAEWEARSAKIQADRKADHDRQMHKMVADPVGYQAEIDAARRAEYRPSNWTGD